MTGKPSELMPINNRPLSLQAKQALRTLHENPNPEQLYPLQLARLSLDRMPRTDRADLLEALDVLDGQPPSRVWQLLTLNPTTREPYLPLPNNLNPQELADALLLQLRDSLRASELIPSRSVA